MDMKLYGMLKALIDEAGITDVNELKADIDELYSLLSGKMYFRGETTTPLYDGATTNPIVINGTSTVIEAGNLVIYNDTQFVYDGTRWILLSTVSALGALAYKDSASATYTPRGTVSQPTFSGSSMTSTGSYTPAGSVSKPTFTGTQATIKPTVTAAGTVSKPNVNVTKTTTTVNSITNVGSLPTLATAVSNETLSFTFGRGSLPTKGADTTVMTNATAALASAPTFTGTQVQGSATYTPTGTVSQPSFSGTQSSVSVSGTPTGTVSQPAFSGTEVTIVST